MNTSYQKIFSSIKDTLQTTTSLYLLVKEAVVSWLLLSTTKDNWIYLMITLMNRSFHKLFLKNVNYFNNSYKKLISKEDKFWASLITIPKIHGLPKTHKPEIPSRPIISGISLAPIKVSKAGNHSQGLPEGSFFISYYKV